MGKQWKQCLTLFLGGSKITADGDCSHEIKRRLLLRRKVMTFLDSILKSRDITLPTNVHLVKAMFFPVVMYGCEKWTIKKAECQRIDAFELWCWKRLLRVPWTARRSNQSILNQSWILTGRTDAEAETPILWPPDVKNWLLGKDPDAGKDWREKGTTVDEMVGWHHQLLEFTQTHVHRVSEAIQPSHPLSSPSSPTFNPFPASGPFQMSQLFASGGQSFGVSATVSTLSMNIWDWFPLESTVGSPCSPRDSQESSPTPQFKSINSLVLSFLYSPTLTCIHDHWKNHSFD